MSKRAERVEFEPQTYFWVSFCDLCDFEGSGNRGRLWEVGRGRGVPLVRLRRVLADGRGVGGCFRMDFLVPSAIGGALNISILCCLNHRGETGETPHSQLKHMEIW